MQIKHHADGKTETIHAGAVLAGCRLSEVTFTADDAEEILRNVSREQFVEWFFGVVLMRFPPAVRRAGEKPQPGIQLNELLATEADMQNDIQIMRDEVAERLDELADLFFYWQKNRAKGKTPAAVRNAILMAMDEIALLRAAKAIPPEVIDQFRKQVSG